MPFSSAYRPRRAAALAVIAAAVLAVPTVASAASGGPAVGPDQFFTGTVVDATSTSSASSDVIVVDCVASSAAATGNPAPGQFVEVNPAPAVGAVTGFTGSAADGIEADLIWSLTNPPITVDDPIASLTAYATPSPIPTDIQVPCSGTGVLSFVPQPGSATAQTYTLHITFVSPVA
jgi:hypothetical protein